MKNYLTITLFALGLLVTAGCGNQNANKNLKAEILEVDKVLEGAEASIGKLVQLEGVCSHLCAHGGKKLFLLGSDESKILRVESGEKTGNFKQECVSSMVQIIGYLREQRIDETYLAQLEAADAHAGHNHGEGEEEACGTEQAAQGETVTNSTAERVANFRARIAERNAAEGKNYLSTYYIDAESYTIL